LVKSRYLASLCLAGHLVERTIKPFSGHRDLNGSLATRRVADCLLEAGGLELQTVGVL